MAITTAAQYYAAMKKAQIIYFYKAALSSTIANGWAGTFRAGGTPGQGAIPTAATVCDETTLGGFVYKQPTGSNKLYLAEIEFQTATSAVDVQLHDRLIASGGLVGNITTLQTTNLPVDASVATSNMAERIGAADYSEIQWWLEWYTATGATPTTITVNYTAADNTTGSLSPPITPATVGALRMILLPYPNDGKFIKRIDSISLTPSTGTAGNFGITATRAISGVSIREASMPVKQNLFGLGLPNIKNQSCLQTIHLTPGSSTTIAGARFMIIEG